MTSSTTSRPHQYSWLLQLPREVRDLIYEQALVRDVIPIEAAVIKIPDAMANRSPVYCRNIRGMLPSRFPWSHRRLWSVPALDFHCDFGPGDHAEDPRSSRRIYMTYQLAACAASSLDPIEIRLLQTCKQVYSEARETFYCRNVFSFTSKLGLPTAFTFLCDRPAASLRLISSLELSFVEDNNMSGTTEAHYPIMRRSTDSLVLRYAYNHFTDLCTLLSTPRMQLRNLYLTVDTAASRQYPTPMSFQECISRAASRTTQNTPLIASWLDPLMRIDGLELIQTRWILDQHRLRRTTDTLYAMQQWMLRSVRSRAEPSEGTSSNNLLRMRVLHEEKESDKVCLTQDDLNSLLAGDVIWQDYTLTVDGR